MKNIRRPRLSGIVVEVRKRRVKILVLARPPGSMIDPVITGKLKKKSVKKIQPGYPVVFKVRDMVRPRPKQVRMAKKG